jgi:hypothetical protein
MPASTKNGFLGFHAMAQQCSTCKGQGWLNLGSSAAQCPMCEGTGKQWDPGREFTYEMGPFSLNAPAVAAATNSQNFSGAATTANQLQGVSCQIANYPFRCMFVMARSTFPFAIQPSDAGSGSGRYFVPQQTLVHSENFFGDSRHPMPWPTPYIFQRNQNITANVQDLAGATGFVSVANGSNVVTWVSGGLFNVNTAFGPPFPGVSIWSGAVINIGGVNYVISSAAGQGVQSQTELTLATTYAGTTNADIAYSVQNTIRIAFKGQELSNTPS